MAGLENMQRQGGILQKIAPYSADLMDPFFLRHNLTTVQKIKAAFVTVTLFPVRVVLMGAIFTLTWIFAKIGLQGFPEDELQNKKPLTGWRRFGKSVIVFLGRLTFAIGGWNWISVKGTRASREEAPILIVVPHTSFWDTVAVYALGCPSVVVRDATATTPVFGDLIRYCQPVFVRRDDPRSRHTTVEEIRHRCFSNDGWEQVLIFPEGTCGNRQALLDFKLGAFYPGVPVQPVFIRYPNKLDSLTWTWDGPGAWRQIWLTLCQFHIFSELEFLPVYYPSADERNNPRLFAENCRRKISSMCNIPMSYFSLDDVKYLMHVKTQNLPKTVPLVKLIKLRARNGKENLDIATELNLLNMNLQNMEKMVCDVENFAKYIGCDLSENIKDFFLIMDQEKSGAIDVRVYNVGLWFLRSDLSEFQRLENCFKVFDRRSGVTSSEFAAIIFLWKGLPLKVANDLFLILNMKSKPKTTISFKSLKSVASTYLQWNNEQSNGTETRKHHQKMPREAKMGLKYA